MALILSDRTTDSDRSTIPAGSWLQPTVVDMVLSLPVEATNMSITTGLNQIENEGQTQPSNQPRKNESNPKNRNRVNPIHMVLEPNTR